MRLSYHFPTGDPCRICKRPASSHRITHASEGNPCARCGYGAGYHTSIAKRVLSDKESPQNEYLGIDGEGQGREDHRYIFLAVSSSDGTQRWSIDGKVESETDKRRVRLTTKESLDFILSIPKTKRTKIFAYAFQYDLTKILTDVDTRSLYRLFRPETRKRRPDDTRKGLIPIYWHGYVINLQASKFTVKKGPRRATIWDIFKFFQGRFVAAIQDWKVGTPALWERMARMKEQRADFDKLDWDSVKEYCYEECASMAALAQTDVHVGVPVDYLAHMLSGFAPIHPREVSDGPVFENAQKKDEIDILEFPAPKWHLLDGGNYLGTADIVVMKCPDTQKINLGTYRLQVHDPKTLGIAINPGHHGGIIEEKYWERGLSCPVAVSLGHDPRLATAASMYILWGASEYEYAGWLEKKPVEIVLGPVTGLPIPQMLKLQSKEKYRRLR